MPESFHERLADALSRVVSPRHGADVLSADLVRDVATTTSGRVRLTLLLSPEDSPTLARDVRHAVEGVEGVTEVRVEVRDPAELRSRSAAAPAGRALPVIDTRVPAQGPASAGM